MLSRLLTKREQLVLSAVALSILVGSVVLCVGRSRVSAPAIELKPSVSEAAVSDVAAAPKPAPPPEAPASLPVAVAAAAPAPEPAKPAPITVAVAGAVGRPDLYTFEPGSRVSDALSRAGGAAEEADLSDINAAAELLDGTTLTVPYAAQRGMQGGRLVIRPAVRASEVNPPGYTISGSRAVRPAANARPVEEPAAGATAPAVSGGLMNLNTATAEQLQELPGIGPKLAAEIVDYRSKTPFTRVEDLQNVKGIGPKRFETLKPLVTVQ